MLNSCVNDFRTQKSLACKNEPLPQYVCDYRGAIPVTSLLPRTFANIHQLVNAKRCWGLIPKPGNKPGVDVLLPVLCGLVDPFLLAASRCLTAWQGFLRGAGTSWRAKGGYWDPSSPGWGTWTEYLKVHISKLLRLWPNPVQKNRNKMYLFYFFSSDFKRSEDVTDMSIHTEKKQQYKTVYKTKERSQRKDGLSVFESTIDCI